MAQPLSFSLSRNWLDRLEKFMFGLPRSEWKPHVTSIWKMKVWGTAMVSLLASSTSGLSFQVFRQSKNCGMFKATWDDALALQSSSLSKWCLKSVFVDGNKNHSFCKVHAAQKEVRNKNHKLQSLRLCLQNHYLIQQLFNSVISWECRVHRIGQEIKLGPCPYL